MKTKRHEGYYVCLYLQDMKCWKRHGHEFARRELAEAAMDQFIRSNRDALEETTDEGVLRLKNKLSIFSVYQWNLLAVGYKHPDDRTKQVPVKDMRSADKRERMTLIGHKLKEAFAAQA